MFLYRDLRTFGFLKFENFRLGVYKLRNVCGIEVNGFEELVFTLFQVLRSVYLEIYSLIFVFGLEERGGWRLLKCLENVYSTNRLIKVAILLENERKH